MYVSVCSGREILVAHPDVSPPAETLILREHIRKILRKLSRMSVNC